MGSYPATDKIARVRSQRWLPASVIALRQYSSRAFVSDLIAGVTVALVALPLAMAFAISSGMTPQAGLYCAVVTGFLISALGAMDRSARNRGGSGRVIAKLREQWSRLESCARHG